MARSVYKSYYAISPKRFDDFWGNQQDTLTRAYIVKLIRKANATNLSVCDTRSIFCAAFGDKWYLKPYTQLYRLVSAATVKGKGGTLPEMPADNSDFKLSITTGFTDSSLARIMCKFYSKRSVKEFLESQRCKSELDVCSVMEKLRNAIKLARFYAVYDSKDLRKLKKLTGQQIGDMQYNTRNIKQRLNKDEYGAMPKHILQELVHDELEKSLCDMLNKTTQRSDKDEFSIMLENVYARIWAYAWRTSRRNYYNQEQYINKMCDAYETYTRIKEMRDMAATLDMKPYSDCSAWHKNKICNKAYKALKQIYETDMEMPAKREAIKQVSRAMCNEYDTYRVWAPRFVER